MKKTIFIFIIACLNALCLQVNAQVDTLNAHRTEGISRVSADSDAGLQATSVATASAPTEAPLISYGGSRILGVNQDVNWMPVNSGGAGQFAIAVEQTYTGYYNPLGAVCAADGTLFIANTGYHSILKRTTGGTQSLLAGGNSTAYGFVNGTGSAARFRHPSFLAIDASGNIYVADQQNHRIRKVTPSGVVTTFAGSGSIGSANGTGTAASFQYPMGLAFGPDGNLYVADAYNNKIRKITPSGVVSDHAGSGIQGTQDGTLATARFYQPKAIRFDSNGDLYVADRLNNILRKVSGGNVTTIAGSGTTGFVDGQGTASSFNGLSDMAVKRGNIYVVDMLNNAIRFVSPSGNVMTISTSGQITNPYSVAEAPDGSFFIAENTSNRIKKVRVNPAFSIHPALPTGLFFDEATGRITGKVATALSQQTYTVTAANGFGFHQTSVTFSVSNNGVVSPSVGQNYIVTHTPRKAGYNSMSSLEGSAVEDVNVAIQYFDGLGRPSQMVQWQAGANEKKDIVQYQEYDSFGREANKYLLYADDTSGNGSFKQDGKTKQEYYYTAVGAIAGKSTGWDRHIKKTSRPYAVTVFDNSPLNRVFEQGAPGTIWQPISVRGSASSTGRTVAFEYGTNAATGAETVRRWTVSYTASKPTGAASTSNYAGSSLYKNVIKNENWISAHGKGGVTEEYRDFRNLVVLTRVWETDTKKLDTYYIYDDLGDLCYVVPPIVTATLFSEVSTDLNFQRYIYAYHYDGRRRLIEKKIPGKGWEYFAYNLRNEEVLRQDAAQRIAGHWSYTKYDAFGRVAYTGIYTNTLLNTQAAAQMAINDHRYDNLEYLWEERNESANYTDRAFPIVGSTMPHVTNYYDDYTFAGANNVTLQAVGIVRSQKTKELVTGSRITNTDGLEALITVNYYDNRGRILQSVSQNQLGGTDYVTNTYNFVGELISSKRDHKSSQSSPVTTVLTTNSYDHVGRLKTTRKRVNTQPEILQSSLTYNEIGQLKQKDLHGSGTNAVQQMSYSYNERGWTDSINNPSAVTEKRRFGMKLIYGNKADAYNGNIGAVQWNTLVKTGQTQTPTQNYTYSYDKLNRLTKAAYTGGTRNNFYNEELAYDVMGNIDSLRRSNGSLAWYNNFKYSYDGNRLISVTDAGSANRTNSFTYDMNGNGNSNSRLAITNIEYNYLNLPKRFVKTSENLTYIYDATGSKRTKTFGTSNVTQYIDGIQYKNGAIEFIQTEEGRILPNGSSFTYEYFLSDHLGNTRAVVDNTGELKQLQDYYAFGMEMNTGGGLNSASNLYKYNGNEKQPELGLDQVDYGARLYDPEIGRWNVVDPLSEVHYNLTGYNYVMSNPLLYMDMHGLDTLKANDPDFIRKYKEGDVGEIEPAVANAKQSNGKSSWLTNKLADIGSYGSDHPYFARKNWYIDYRRQMDAARDPAIDLLNFASVASGVGEGMLLARGGLMLIKGGVPLLLRRFALRNGVKTGGRVFWSGGDVAKNAAAEFAAANGMKTLEMTTIGRIMNSISPYLPRKISGPIWNKLSSNFAKGAVGEINVFQNAAGVSLRSTWRLIEYPILKTEKIIYHIVK